MLLILQMVVFDLNHRNVESAQPQVQYPALQNLKLLSNLSVLKYHVPVPTVRLELPETLASVAESSYHDVVVVPLRLQPDIAVVLPRLDNLSQLHIAAAAAAAAAAAEVLDAKPAFAAAAAAVVVEVAAAAVILTVVMLLVVEMKMMICVSRIQSALITQEQSIPPI